MKTNSIIYIFVFLNLFFLSSCSNSDYVDIKHPTEFEIDLIPVVDVFTYQLSTDELKTLPPSCELEVMLLLYNNSTGDLSYQESARFTSYSNIARFKTDVSTIDNYTALVVTRVITKKGTLYWSLSNEENIKTLRITPNTSTNDYGSAQILGLGSSKIISGKSNEIKVGPAGGIYIPRVKCDEQFTTLYEKFKVWFPKYGGEYVFDNDGRYRYLNNTTAANVAIELDPKDYFIDPSYSYYALYTYKFVPIQTEFILNSIITQNNEDEYIEVARSEFTWEISSEYVQLYSMGRYAVFTGLGSATAKNYKEECDKNDYVLGHIYNSSSHNILSIDTQINKIDGVIYLNKQ